MSPILYAFIIICIFLCTCAIIVAALAAYGAARWSRATQLLWQRLENCRNTWPILGYDAQEISNLPAPVKRYFQTVLQDGQPIIAAVTVEHTGTFNLSSNAEKWLPFHSRQRVVTRQPGFVWDASIAMLPGIAVRVHDAYIDGEGILKPAILGLFSMAGKPSARDLAEGEFIRYFAEAAWYPTALLPSQGVHWQAVDASSASASFSDGKTSATMLVKFNQAGLIDSVSVAARAVVNGDTVTHTPWEGRWSNYQQRHGILVPLSAEAAWLHPEGRHAYWRGTIRMIAYEFAEEALN